MTKLVLTCEQVVVLFCRPAMKTGMVIIKLLTWENGWPVSDEQHNK